MSLLHAHVVFVTTYRRPIFTDTMLTFCEHTMRAVCNDLDNQLVEFNGEADHVHLPVAYPPTIANIGPRAAAQRPHGLRDAAQIHRHLCPRPHARTSLVTIVFRRPLPRRAAVDHQALHRPPGTPTISAGLAPGDKRDGLTPDSRPRGLRPRIPVTQP
ncbi:transposase [Mycobacterium sp.]|uniref:transposase n=1 Tax=Mycobacterium sp. TaxID=1785 RepID=UPI003BAED757